MFQVEYNNIVGAQGFVPHPVLSQPHVEVAHPAVPPCLQHIDSRK